MRPKETLWVICLDLLLRRRDWLSMSLIALVLDVKSIYAPFQPGI